MRVIIAGASGLVGRQLMPVLRKEGIDVRRLVRRAAAGADEVSWDPQSGRLDAGALEGVDGVINLSGRNLFGRWTARVKADLVNSRIHATRLLVDAITKAAARPKVLVSVSAVGYYGSRGDEVLTETSSAGTGFLADLAKAWEAEAQRATGLGVRVVSPRFGLVLARGGGALGPMVPLFWLGLGGPIGGGRHWWSWVHIDDVCAAIVAALTSPSLQGPVNVVAPAPVTNREFSAALARVLHRPAILAAPAFAVRLVFGEMADEMVLASHRVMPARLQAEGFAFRWQDLDAALENLTTS